MEIENASWLETFAETCQDLQEDTLLLEALSLYVLNEGKSMRGNRAEYFPQVFYRLCGYLSQHTLDLHNLGKRFGLEPLMESSP